MEAEVNPRMLFHEREKGIIGIRVTFFENVLEITRGLVGVNDQDEVEWRLGCAHGDEHS
jgi:hypothetical protein